MSRWVVIISVVASITLVIDARGSEAVITVNEASVRSGRSFDLYATGILRQGTKVNVLREEGDFLAITPPAGSFSLIAKEDVNAQPDKTGVVLVDQAETIVGSALTDRRDVRGTRLPRGSAVTILGEETVSFSDGMKTYYRIVPLNEVRYVPVEAVRRSADVAAAGGPGAALDKARVASNRSHMSPQLQQAEEAYRQAEMSGDWRTARKLYEELARGSDHDARMIAWNRLEYIRRQPQTPVVSARPNGPRDYESSRPNAAARYPTARAVQDSRADPNWHSTSTPTNESSSTRAGFRPAAPAAASSAQAQAPGLQSSGPGRLHKSIRRLADGRKLYFLEDSRGQLRCYVAATGGLELDPYVGQRVELRGGPMQYHSALRGDFFSAEQVRPLQ